MYLGRRRDDDLGMSEKNSITDLTRRNIFDYLTLERVAWAGRLEETQFVFGSGPTPPTWRPTTPGTRTPSVASTSTGSTTARFNLTGGPDEQFVSYLAELVHPVVRQDEGEVDNLVTEFNRQLRPDGWQLRPADYTSGKPIYAGARVAASHTPATALRSPKRTLPRTTPRSWTTLGQSSATSPQTPPAPSQARKSWSSRCTSSSSTRARHRLGNEDLPKLYKKVAVELGLAKESVPDSAKGSAAAHKVLTSLNTAVFGLAEL
jgi:hypothetical protein